MGGGKAKKPPVSGFNTFVNTREVCGEEALTVKVLDIIRDTLETEGNTIMFNIASKRLAKIGNVIGCKDILIGMLKEGLKPNVVSFTTIGACTKEKNAAAVSMWLKRISLCDVQLNYHTYNMALVLCLDGKFKSIFDGARITVKMMGNAEKEIACGLKGSVNFRTTLPNSYTKFLARQLMKQLQENWRSVDIEMTLAKTTTRVSLLKLVDFKKKIEASQLEEIQFYIEEEDALEGNKEQDYKLALLKCIHNDDHCTAMV